MIFLGVNPGPKGLATSFVLVRQFLRNVKKHYQVVSVQSFQNDFKSDDVDKTQIEDAIVNIYHDRKYIKTKPVFSQDRRPPKSIRAYPQIIISSPSTDAMLVKAIRKRKIPVQNLSVHDEPLMQQKPRTSAYGGDYDVFKQDLIDTLMSVCEQDRLIFDPGGPNEKKDEKKQVKTPENFQVKQKLMENVERAMPAGEDPDRVLTALSLPIWFRERVRIIRRY